MNEQSSTEKIINCQIEVPASLDRVWSAWTTEEGVKSFFAPNCRIELKPGGSYEMLFDLNAKEGMQGGEGMIILAIQSMQMLSFTWNAPPSLPNVRGQMTHVTVRFNKIDVNKTNISIRHDGWGNGTEWDAAFDYFIKGWGNIGLPRLRYRFEIGVLEWSNLPVIENR